MKNTLRNNIKKVVTISAVGLISLSLVGGTSTYAYDDDYYEDRYDYVDDRYDYMEDRYDFLEDRYEEQARFNYIQKQANVKLKTQDEVKDIVAKSLNRDKSSIWFDKVEISDDFLSRYVYEVEARVGYTEYNVKVDAKTGEVLSSRIDY